MLKEVFHKMLENKQKHMIFYHRNENGQPEGVVVAFQENGEIYIGWSKCNPKHDKYDKYKGLLNALSKKRAAKLSEEPSEEFKKIPSCMLPLLSKVLNVVNNKVQRKLWNSNSTNSPKTD